MRRLSITLLLLCSWLFAASAANDRPPNIVLIFAGDLGWMGKANCLSLKNPDSLIPLKRHFVSFASD